MDKNVPLYTRLVHRLYVACTALVRALDDHPPNLGGPLPSPGGHWAAGGAVGSYIGVDGHIIYIQGFHIVAVLHGIVPRTFSKTETKIVACFEHTYFFKIICRYWGGFYVLKSAVKKHLL